MNTILVSADSRYPISRPKIKQAINDLLAQKKITSPVEVSVLVCGTRQARILARKYLGDNQPHNVLSFNQNEEVEGRLILGDIVVCYPLAQKEADRDNLLVDEKVNKLVGHGLLHLLGEDHPE